LPISSSAAEISVRRVRDEDLRCHVGVWVVGGAGGAFRPVRAGAEAGFDLPLEGARVGWSTRRPFPFWLGLLGVGVSDASVRARSCVGRFGAVLA
jgi:hypothetical protein